MPYATNNDVKTYYEVSGVGPDMVLIHANPFDHTLFLYQIAHFSARFRVLAVDIRGYGRSDPVTTPFGLADINADVLAACTQEGIASAIVMGVSIGSTAGLKLALERPDFCKALIAVGAGYNKSERAEARAESYRTHGLDYHREHIEQLVAPEFPATPMGDYLIATIMQRARALKWQGAAMGRVLTSGGDEDLRPLLPAMTVPTLIINGAYDNSLPRGTETAKLIPGAVHTILPGTGHACCLEDPAAFDTAVTDFLGVLGLLPAA